MTDYLVVSLAAVVAGALTLVSGFGLGTLLLPVFAVFLPAPMAVAATAVVHLANNLFKLALVGRHASRSVVLRFGVPAVIAALVGAALLNLLAHVAPLVTYELGNRACQITPVKLLVAALVIASAIMDIVPKWSRMGFDAKQLVAGGIASGLFGGISGHQGALRSAFLIKAGLGKEEFIGTGVVIAVAVDIARLLVYGAGFGLAGVKDLSGHAGGLILAASLAASFGSFAAAGKIQKMTYRGVQVTVGVMLVLIGLAMGSGLI